LLNSASQHLVLRPAGKKCIARGCGGGSSLLAAASQINFIPHFQRGYVSDCSHAWWEVSHSGDALPVPQMAAQGCKLQDHIMPIGRVCYQGALQRGDKERRCLPPSCHF